MIIDPKLIQVSACKKYVYPVDSITGAKTFAPIAYFEANVNKKYGGSVARFVKEYITRDTKKYLAAGYTPEQVKEIASKTKNHKLPKISTKPTKDPRAPKKERKKKLSTKVGEDKTVVNNDGSTEVIRVYPWSANPTTYFCEGEPTPLNIAETTKIACLRPDVYLDSDCYGCPHYSVCQCELKIIPKK
jgi:hypothetical protein